MKRQLAKGLMVCAWGLMTLASAPLSLAHEGHDHAEAPPVPISAAGPRFTAASADLEMVGSLEGETLVVYVDRFASNEPVLNAQVELESGDWKAVLTSRSDGAYVAPAGPLARPGRYALVATVEAGDLTDLLDATLAVPPPSATEAQTPDDRLKHALHYASGTVGGLALAGLGWWVMQRRRRT